MINYNIKKKSVFTQTGQEQKALYYDKNNELISCGDYIMLDGDIKHVLISEDGYLGTDSTNPSWILEGRAYEGQYGLYPLTEDETDRCEVLKEYKPIYRFGRCSETIVTLTFDIDRKKFEKTKYWKQIEEMINDSRLTEYNIEEHEY